jgi:metal-dependent HD superfamily phosphatase/phosphodiesterase
MSAATRTFIRHYIEMVVAMMLGMVVLGVPAVGALRAMGTSYETLQNDAPAAALLGMATVMTVPMVGWMRYRGHGWRPNAEMAASMFLPTFAIIALLAASVVEGFMTLMMLEHIVMPMTMLGAMLLRPQEYTAHRAVTA